MNSKCEHRTSIRTLVFDKYYLGLEVGRGGTPHDLLVRRGITHDVATQVVEYAVRVPDAAIAHEGALGMVTVLLNMLGNEWCAYDVNVAQAFDTLEDADAFATRAEYEAYDRNEMPEWLRIFGREMVEPRWPGPLSTVIGDGRVTTHVAPG